MTPREAFGQFLAAQSAPSARPTFAEPICLCPAASEYDPPCPMHGVRPIGMSSDGSRAPGEYDPPHVVGSDTSKAAAESVAAHAPILREQVLAQIAKRGAVGATCDEIEVSLNGRHQTISARVRELAKDGLIVDSGKRRPTRSGRTASVYVVKVQA